jgi:hypothetical protein
MVVFFFGPTVLALLGGPVEVTDGKANDGDVPMSFPTVVGLVEEAVSMGNRGFSNDLVVGRLICGSSTAGKNSGGDVPVLMTPIKITK